MVTWLIMIVLYIQLSFWRMEMFGELPASRQRVAISQFLRTNNFISDASIYKYPLFIQTNFFLFINFTLPDLLKLHQTHQTLQLV